MRAKSYQQTTMFTRITVINIVKRRLVWRRWTIVVLLLTTGLMAQVGFAETIYVYDTPDGSKLITDKPRSGGGFKLIKRYQSNFGSSPGISLQARKSLYDPLIEQTATNYGVDIALVKAVVHAESSFNPAAVSHKGATGLMQLMPATAQRYGVNNLTDPDQNVDGGVRYLRDLLKMFRHDTRLAVAAYNAGENAVIQFQGIPPYDETQNYVRRVLELHEKYLTFVQ